MNWNDRPIDPRATCQVQMRSWCGSARVCVMCFFCVLIFNFIQIFTKYNNHVASILVPLERLKG